MRGEILHYDETQGFGFVAGTDGNRYAFGREDLRRAAPLSKGTQVEFQASGGQARDVFSIQAAANGVAATAAPQSFGRFAGQNPMQSTSMWSYFWRGVTANYANFHGRARRKEYWSFYLFWLISLLLVTCVGFGIDGASGNQQAPVTGFVLLGLFILATLIPNISIVVRRIHDIGLSGWFYLLIFVPVGGLIILVFSLIPSQGHDNKWGPVPAGVKVPPPYVPASQD